jgi:hypothetical protein
MARSAHQTALPTRREILAASLFLPASAARAGDPEFFTFDMLYKSFGVRGIEYSERLLATRGRTMAITGYMAPPLKAESTFFVLTREPMAICPFCQSDADWPVDILVVYLAEASPLVSAGAKVTVTGRLEIGSWTDPENGFVSQLRLRDANYRKS